MNAAAPETGLDSCASRRGVYTTKPFVHDYWEEVLLISGDLIVGNDENGNGGEFVRANDVRMSTAGRRARSVQIHQWLSAVRTPLLRLILQVEHLTPTPAGHKRND